MLNIDSSLRKNLDVISFGRHRGRYKCAIALCRMSPCALGLGINCNTSIFSTHDSNTESGEGFVFENSYPSSTICTSRNVTPLETNLHVYTGSGIGGAVPRACVSPLYLRIEGLRQMYGLARGFDPPSPQQAFVEVRFVSASLENKQGLRSNRHSLPYA